MSTPNDPSDAGTDGLSAEERRVVDHRDLSPQERQTAEDYGGSGNDGRSSAHRPAAGIPEGADPAQRPLEGTSEEFPVAEGVRTSVEMDEPARRHGESDPGSSGAAAGSVPAAAAEQTQTDNPYPAETWKRPVTGVHRPAAPDGEVGAE
jgi:hypothetical protein